MGRDIKITVVGDTSVGKTSLLISYTTNSFPGEHVPTVFDNYSANAIVDEEPITLGLWDTAGSSEYNELRPLSYPGTDAFIVCYSIIDPNSLKCVSTKWVPEIQEHCPEVPIILVGTKLDLRNKPEAHVDGVVSVPDANEMAKKINAVTLIECSALTQERLPDVFQQTIRAVINPGSVTQNTGGGGATVVGEKKAAKAAANASNAKKTPSKGGEKKKKKKARRVDSLVDRKKRKSNRGR